MTHAVTVVPLGELGERVVILRGIAHSAVGQTGAVPVHSIRTLRDDLDPVGFVDLPTSRYGAEYLTRPGDILLSLDNPGIRNILLVNEGMPVCTVTQQILILRAQDRSSVDPTFLFGWLCGPAFQRELARFSTGSAMPRVARDAVLRIGVPLPPLEDQQRIGRRLQQLEEAADTHRRTAAKIAQLRDLELAGMSALFQVGKPSSGP
jgi:type I restriction enzyme, S subunit